MLNFNKQGLGERLLKQLNRSDTSDEVKAENKLKRYTDLFNSVSDKQIISALNSGKFIDIKLRRRMKDFDMCEAEKSDGYIKLCQRLNDVSARVQNVYFEDIPLRPETDVINTFLRGVISVRLAWNKGEFKKNAEQQKKLTVM